MKRILALVAVAVLATACSKEEDVAPPAELVDFDPLVRIDRVWSTGTKGGDDVLRLGLRPAVEGERVYVAGHGGDVQALELANGRDDLARRRGPRTVRRAGGRRGPRRRRQLGRRAGRARRRIRRQALAGRDRRRGAHGADDRRRDRRRAHRGRPPAWARVADGIEAWNYEQPVPRLTLRGNGAPVVDGDMVFAGLDNGKVVALSLTTGELLWTTTVAPSHGRTEIERLVDIDSPCASSATTSSSSATRAASPCSPATPASSGGGGTCRAIAASPWTATRSTSRPPTAPWWRSAGATARRSGRRTRCCAARSRRRCSRTTRSSSATSTATCTGSTRRPGRLLARGKTGGGRMSNAPVAAGDLLLLQTDSGDVQAWRAAGAGRG